MKHLHPLVNRLCLKRLAHTVMVAAIFSVSIIGAAHADNDKNRGNHYGQNKNNARNYNYNRQWRNHENNNRRYWNQRHYAPQPTVVYAPPTYYYPEPVYQSPGLNFIFPLHIR